MTVVVPCLGRSICIRLFDRIVEASARNLGYQSLREEQTEAVKAFLGGRDVFVALPTGSGKSVCYTVLPVVVDNLRKELQMEVSAPSCILVVSPLVSLMEDQVAGLTARGIRSVCATDQPEGDFWSGNSQVIFLSPETLSGILHKGYLNEEVPQNRLIGIAVDEAHCIKEWGSSFRQEFLCIGEVRSVLPKHIRVMALTATATSATRKVIARSLDMVDCLTIAKVPSQVNIKYEVKPSSDKGFEQFTAPLIQELQETGTKAEKTIVYCRTYKDLLDVFQEFVVKLNAALVVRDQGQRVGRLVEKYDACTDASLKARILDNFVRPHGVTRIVIATTAFGMGIDSPNVRRVIHWGPPTSVSMYVQEVGRCGRDQLQSTATLYLKGHAGASLDEDMYNYCQQKDTCRRSLLMTPFLERGKDYLKPSLLHLCCDICSLSCECLACDTSVHHGSVHDETPSRSTTHHEQFHKRRPLSPAEVQQLQTRLLQFRISKLGAFPVHSAELSTIELLTTISDAMIATIVKHHATILLHSDVIALCPTLSKFDAVAICDILDSFY